MYHPSMSEPDFSCEVAKSLAKDDGLYETWEEAVEESSWTAPCLDSLDTRAVIADACSGPGTKETGTSSVVTVTVYNGDSNFDARCDVEVRADGTAIGSAGGVTVEQGETKEVDVGVSIPDEPGEYDLEASTKNIEQA